MDDLDLISPDQILLKELKEKPMKEYIVSVKQNEICLFCNLYDLFTSYEYI